MGAKRSSIKGPKKGTKRALVYGRLSDRPEKDSNSTSIERQIEEITEYCERNNIELVDTYTDDRKSGRSFKGRDGFKAMFSRVLKKEEEIDYIIVHKQDRLSRNTLDTLYIKERLESHGKHMIAVADHINTEDPKSDIFVHVMALFAEIEREFISFRTNEGMERKAKDGHYLGGKVTGYKSIDKELVLIPEEVKIVKYIFEKYALEKWGYKRIASSLNIQGIKTKRGKYWTSNAVKTILENEMYIGNTTWRGKINKGKHDRIIDELLWKGKEKVMNFRSYIPEKIHPGSYPLSGLLKCSQCGGPMVQGNSDPKYKYYQCNNNKNSGSSVCSSNLVKKEHAEEYVLKDFLNCLKEKVSPEVIYSTTKSILNYDLNPLENEAGKLKKQIKKLEDQIFNLMDLTEDETLNLDEEMMKSRISVKQEEIYKNKSVLENITMQIDLKKNKSLIDIIKFSIKNFEDFYHTLSDDEKKLFFHSVIKKVHVTKGKKTKDRRIKDVIYLFDLEDLNRLAEKE
ncbi:site-specific DNA recombinase [Virgibacillus subterraneus]|uniref:Site-specific DNA recombinase n=1 Tax=Virgibacillus subterraneus TaxID=621109 RepID=A0A1H8ZBI1_9BACI|nr:recombinase family protein [Virgibacillus subterraneus]SEP61770.1 site-specific DNA recombinase [Virgibacillus subterraneus]